MRQSSHSCWKKEVCSLWSVPLPMTFDCKAALKSVKKILIPDSDTPDSQCNYCGTTGRFVTESDPEFLDRAIDLANEAWDAALNGAGYRVFSGPCNLGRCEKCMASFSDKIKCSCWCHAFYPYFIHKLSVHRIPEITSLNVGLWQH